MDASLEQERERYSVQYSVPHSLMAWDYPSVSQKDVYFGWAQRIKKE
jgi:hypothetical protein